MKLFLDEDNGTGIPKALSLVRPSDDEIHFPSHGYRQLIKRGMKDREWIPIVGHQGWLVFSQNKWMVNNEEERQLLVEHNVGVVFLSSGNEKAMDVLRLLVNKWSWLRQVDAEARPFAYLISPVGRARSVDLRSDAPLRGLRGGGVGVFGVRRPQPPLSDLPPETRAAVPLRLPGL